MAVAPFPTQPELIAVTIAYRNKRLIADEVLPRVPVGKQEFKYLKYNMAEGFTIPDTRVGRTSQPNQVNFSATEEVEKTEDYGLDDPVPQADIDNAPPNYNPLLHAVEGTTDLILLDREVRTAGVVFNAATYGTHKITMGGANKQFQDPESDPIGVIMDGLDSLLLRPNTMVLGKAVYSKLVRHPKVVKAFHGNAGDAGIATRQFLAQLFELDQVLVGEGFVNIARKGKEPNLARVWGKHIALLTISRTADTQRGATFGLTAQWGQRIAGSSPDKNIGLRGGQVVRVGESVKELITAPDLGYFIENAVA